MSSWLPAGRPPWGSRPSISGHIQARRVEGEDDSAPLGQLPDDSDVIWVAGSADDLFDPADLEKHRAAAASIFERLQEVIRAPTDERLADLYEALRAVAAVGVYRPLLDHIVETTRRGDGLDGDRIHELAVWLAVNAADREPVKIALALLSLPHQADDRDLLTTLAQHEEFTFYSVLAISMRDTDPETTLWRLAQQVDGCGKIAVVERLATHATRPDVKAWLLREGHKNCAAYRGDRLFFVCATAGELHEALAVDAIDDPLLHGAGDIIRGLIVGEDRDIYRYPFGVTVISAYLRHLDGRLDALDHFLVLKTLGEFLEGEDDGLSWPSEARKSMRASVEALVGEDSWHALALEGLRSSDEEAFWAAAEAAESLGIDVWSEYYSRALAGEDDWIYWAKLMQSSEPSRVEKVVQLAETRLPLAEIGKGPGREMAVDAHLKLDLVVAGLREFVGLGWSLVRAALRSSVPRNRWSAISVLKTWGLENWPEGALELVKECHLAEPEDFTRAKFERLLAGRPATGH